jgi:hypothetical protein
MNQHANADAASTRDGRDKAAMPRPPPRLSGGVCTDRLRPQPGSPGGGDDHRVGNDAGIGCHDHPAAEQVE